MLRKFSSLQLELMLTFEPVVEELKQQSNSGSGGGRGGQLEPEEIYKKTYIPMHNYSFQLVVRTTLILMVGGSL